MLLPQLYEDSLFLVPLNTWWHFEGEKLKFTQIAGDKSAINPKKR
jgi:hypothetical protein